MAVRKISFAAILFVVSYTTAAEPKSIELENQLSACVAVTGMKFLTKDQTPFLSFIVEIKESTAQCGCKSALSSYSVFSKIEEYQSYIIGGKASFTKSGYKELPLAAEQGLVLNKELKLVLSCAQPD